MDITAGLPEIITEALIKTKLIDQVSCASDAVLCHLASNSVSGPGE